MVGLEAFRSRRMIVAERQQLAEQEWALFQALPAPESPDEEAARVQQGVELMAARHILQGRLLEVDAWIEMVSRFPLVETVGQLPTERNMPAYEPQTETRGAAAVKRQREGTHQRQAAELLTVFPDRDGEHGAGAAH